MLCLWPETPRIWFSFVTTHFWSSTAHGAEGNSFHKHKCCRIHYWLFFSFQISMLSGNSLMVNKSCPQTLHLCVLILALLLINSSVLKFELAAAQLFPAVCVCVWLCGCVPACMQVLTPFCQSAVRAKLTVSQMNRAQTNGIVSITE